MEHAFLIRYGLMRHVGRFLAETDAYDRGQVVVIRSRRGTELGEILLALSASEATGATAGAGPARVLRAADPEDLDAARRAERARAERFSACDRVFQDGVWPLQLVDVEPLLEDRRTVLHYLGPHGLDAAGLRATFRQICGLDIVLEPVGRDVPDESEPAAEPDLACERCGSETGGCGTGADHCSSCAIPALIAGRRSRG
ncbi:MAG TPA: PSP1 C-terminal domain-containing protein [Isosphaeraceae bacterium]|jgi:cell fate regulator YaaT (PSP1 superfamily)